MWVILGMCQDQGGCIEGAKMLCLLCWPGRFQKEMVATIRPEPARDCCAIHCVFVDTGTTAFQILFKVPPSKFRGQ
jgi:hypothetical protein